MKSLFRILVLMAAVSSGSSSVRAQWIQTNGPEGGEAKCFTSIDTILFVGTEIGVFRSTNNGTSWTAVSTRFTNADVYALAVSGTNLFAGTNGGGVFLSTNNGTSWTAASTGLTNTTVWSLAVSGTNLFAGTLGGGVWRRPLSEMITSVESVSSEPPLTFSLQQNYPNPFNPGAAISFSLPTSGFVTLKLYSLLGRELSVLVSQNLSPGRYEVQWDAMGLASGVYFYRLQAGSFVETRKMVLMK
jgi:hypothetical protein